MPPGQASLVVRLAVVIPSLAILSSLPPASLFSSSPLPISVGAASRISAPSGRGVMSHAAAKQALGFEEAVARLRSSEPGVRLETVRLLEAAGHLEAAEPIAALLTDRSEDVRRAAIEAQLSLFATDLEPRSRRVALVVEVRSPRSAAAVFERGRLALRPVPVPPAVVRGLAAGAQTGAPANRIEALYTLGTLARPPVDDDTAARVIPLIEDGHPEIRVAAALVAGRLRLRGAGDALVYLLNDAHERARLAAMEALGDIREARALQALADRFQYHGGRYLGEAALRAIARIAHPSSRPLLESLTGVREVSHRRFAMEGLGRIVDRADQAAVRVFEQALVDESEQPVRLAVHFALQRLGHASLDAIVAALSEEAHVRQARDYLIELGPPIVSSLARYLQGPNPATRGVVADVLGLIGDASVLDALAALRADPDAEVARRASRAVARIELRADPGVL